MLTQVGGGTVTAVISNPVFSKFIYSEGKGASPLPVCMGANGPIRFDTALSIRL